MSNRIEDLANAIRRHEGWITPEDKNPKYPNGSPSFRNNNPGNFRCYPLVMGELGATGCRKNLAVFPDFETGWKALKQFLIYAVTDQLRSYKSTMSLLDFYKVYAPSADGNNPLNYASAVAKDLGVGIDTKIGSFIVEPGSISETTDDIKIENQLAYKGARFGVNKCTSIPAYGCKFLCVKYLYEIKLGKKVSVDELNDKLVSGGCYSNGDLLIDSRIAATLGFQFLGKETNINKPPDWTPTIKEVRFSKAWAQHFVVRIINPDGSKKILDPYEGKERKINYYELRCETANWQKGGFSYRKLKI